MQGEAIAGPARTAAEHDARAASALRPRTTAIGAAMAALFAWAAVLAPIPASALEDGTSGYPRGYRDLAAGLLPTAPGLYLRDDLYFYRGSFEEDVPGSAIDADLDLAANVVRATIVTGWQPFGTHHAIGLSWLQTATDLDASFASPAGTMQAHEREFGVGDLALTPLLLGQDWGNWHGNAGVTAWIPVGSYDADRFVNAGRNYWSAGPQIALSWIEPTSGWDVSLAAVYMFNFENDATGYDSGDVVHANFYAGKQVAPWLKLGLAAYALQQVTDDSGSGAMLGDFRAQVFGLGPALRFSLDAGDAPLTLLVKYYREFGAENTFEGDLLSIGTNFRF
jgi:hypothetical protein